MQAEGIDIWAPQVREILESLLGIAYVAGGSAREVIMQSAAPPAEDVDLFLFEADEFNAAHERLMNLGYVHVEQSDRSVTYQVRDLLYELPVQLIKPFKNRWTLTYGEPGDVIRHFSFTTEAFALTLAEAFVVEGSDRDTIDRRLVVQNITDPIEVLQRAMKYAAKGYHMTSEQIEKIVAEWEARNANHL